MATNAPAAFLGYSRDDSDFALRLAEDLKVARANVWINQRDIGFGQLLRLPYSPSTGAGRERDRREGP